MLLVARLITSICSGAFFGVGSIIEKLVSGDKGAGALALIFMGLTIENVGGVSLTSLVGRIAEWCMFFWELLG